MTHDHARDRSGMVHADEDAAWNRRFVGNSIKRGEAIGWDAKIPHANWLVAMPTCIEETDLVVERQCRQSTVFV